MVAPTTASPSPWRRAAATELSTPPDGAFATRLRTTEHPRQLPHLGDDAGHDLRGPVDVGFGALVTQTEPHRAERELARHADSQQNVRWLDRTGGARRATR